MPDISIVTPVFNDLRVVRALCSVLEQKGSFDLEVHVVDGGSRPEVLDAIRALHDPRVHLLSEPDEGIYDAMNKGIGRANSPVLGILNADDRYADPWVLRDVLDALRESPESAGCYGDIVLVDGADRVVRRWRTGLPRRWGWHFGWTLPHPSLFLRRGAYERFGSFDVRYGVASDYEFVYRMSFLSNASFGYLPRTLVRMDAGGASNAGVRAIMAGNRDVWRVWRDSGRPWALHVPLLKLLRKAMQLRWGSGSRLSVDSRTPAEVEQEAEFMRRLAEFPGAVQRDEIPIPPTR